MNCPNFSSNYRFYYKLVLVDSGVFPKQYHYVAMPKKNATFLQLVCSNNNPTQKVGWIEWRLSEFKCKKICQDSMEADAGPFTYTYNLPLPQYHKRVKTRFSKENLHENENCFFYIDSSICCINSQPNNEFRPNQLHLLGRRCDE